MPNRGRMYQNVGTRSSTENGKKLLLFAFGWTLLNERREDVSIDMQQILVTLKQDVQRLHLF